MFELVTPITKDQFETIMTGIVNAANRIESEKGRKITYDESLQLSKQALDTNTGMREYIIKTTGTRHCADWLTTQF